MPYRERPLLVTVQTKRRSMRASVLVVAGALMVVSCSGLAPSPTQARRNRVEDRLRSSFSAAQTTCILDRLDPTSITAIDRTSALKSRSQALVTYSDAVANCVADPSGTPPSAAR